MASLKERKQEWYREIDARVARLLSENPRMVTRAIAAQLGIAYGDVTRSYARLGIIRPTGLNRKKAS